MKCSTVRAGYLVLFATRLSALAMLACGFAAAQTPVSEPLYPIFEDGKWGLINPAGDIALDPRFDQVGRGGRWIPETWDAVSPPDQVLIDMTFSSGVPVTDRVIPVRLDGEYALAGRDGEIIVHGVYERIAEGFGDGLLEVRSGGLRGFIDESGALMIPAQWEDAHRFRNGRAFVRKGGLWGIIDGEGEMIVPPQWEALSYSPAAEWHAFRSDGKWGVVDRDGKIIVPPLFDDIRATPMPSLLPVHNDGRIFYVHPDRKGTVAFEFLCPRKRHRAKSRALGFFNQRVAIVVCGGRYGLIDESGAFLLEPQWDDIRRFENGRAVVKRGDREGLIDESGRFVIELQKNLRLSCCDHAMVGFWRDGAEGFFDLNGNTIFSMHADRVEGISEDLIVVCYEGKDGYVDLAGRWVIPPRFHKAHAFQGPLAFVEQPVSRLLKEIGYINMQGDVVYKTRLGGFIHPDFVIDPAGIERRAEKAIKSRSQTD